MRSQKNPSSTDDFNAVETMDFEDLMKSLETNPAAASSKLVTLTHLTVKPDGYDVDKLLSSGLIPILLQTAKKYAPQTVGLWALVNLDNIALNPATHKAILEANGLEIALDLLRFLKSDQDHELDYGLSSAFLICRCVGREETGPGPEAISGNPRLVEKLKWILTEVLDVGRNGVVIGSVSSSFNQSETP